MRYENIIEVIGNTPIIRLGRVMARHQRQYGVNVYAKLEYMNPGGSIKDRIGYYLIDDAIKRGALKPGGTIIEGTSGNTGFGLAIAAAIKGYRCIFVLPDKMSEEKIRNLRAFGAKVVVTPTAVEPDDPRSYYSVSRRLAKETPNSLYIDQYNNLANRRCHYELTGPEILKQMPDLDVFIAGIGTGGTICGNGKYFKEQKPDVQVVGVDPVGSIVYDKFKTGKDVPATTYKIEGIGEDFIPGNYDFDVIDDMVQVEDKESYLMTRELLVKEGIYSGVSSGAAVVGAMKWIEQYGSSLKGKNILIILPDSGNRYLSKVYNDDWMREAGFLNEPGLGKVEELVTFLNARSGKVEMAQQDDKISIAIEIMSAKGISQLPVVDKNGWVKGVITESAVLSQLVKGNLSASDSVSSVTDSSIEFVNLDDPVEKISRLVTEGKIPLVTEFGKGDGKDPILCIVTKIDLLNYMRSRQQ